jgi:hypothetical protein
VKDVGEPCAGEPHARFDGRELETERADHGHRGGTAARETGGTKAPDLQSATVTAPVPDPTNLGAAGVLRTTSATHDLLLLEQRFDDFGRSAMSTPAHTSAPSAAPPGPARPGPGRVRTPAAAAHQVARQRRGYAAAVVRALARHQRGRTTAQIRRTLRDSLTPLGLRLSPAALHQLATDIAAGRPVELP